MFDDGMKVYLATVAYGSFALSEVVQIRDQHQAIDVPTDVEVGTRAKGLGRRRTSE